jgi:hypothetical protein
MTSSGPERTPSGPGGPVAGSGVPAVHRQGVDPGGLRRADGAVVAGTLLYLVFMIIPWYRIDAFDLGSGFSLPGVSVNGFDSGVLTSAFVLLLLAAVWSLLPASADVPVPFPRAFLTAGLAALAFVLTLIEWLSTVDTGFTLMGLLTVLSSVAVLTVAALRLLPEVVDIGLLPGRLARVAQWANRPVREPGDRPRGS